MTPAQLTANTIRGLSMDAIQKANSGHPGAPMGMADMATVLWTEVAKYDPSDPSWPDRDRIVLSNGHASMLLYSMLHLTGTSLTLDDLKDFRQWGSKTAGHPEFGEAPGIETTTGPLGQGVANAVGMALAEAWLNARFGDDLVDHHTWVFCGDGCLMEGISHEACSLAGHLRLNKLTLLFDDNSITIDGDTNLTCSDDVAARFQALGWFAQVVDGHDHAALKAAMVDAKNQDRPSIICCRTTIGFGSPHMAGTSRTHGAPLGEDEVRATKQALGLDPEAHFVVPNEVLEHVRGQGAERKTQRQAWEARAQEQGAELMAFLEDPKLENVNWPTFETGTSLATRKASHAVLNAVAEQVQNLVGGSADLAGSNGSLIKEGGDLGPDAFEGRNLHFGIREHAMAAVCNGMSLHGGVLPYCATFLTFHDYMRPAVRLAALMHQPVTYIYTHDSVFLGEDGPTHQPVEHLMAMRGIPNLWVVRPGDANETLEAWKMALQRRDGPTAICLTRQGLPIVDRNGLGAAEGLQQGAYVLSDASEVQAVLMATGSEVPLALQAQDALLEQGVGTRVVSFPCWEAFEAQSAEVKDAVLPPGVPRVSVEAGITLGWERYLGGGRAIGIDRFGASAPGAEVAEKLGINVDAVVQAVREVISA